MIHWGLSGIRHPVRGAEDGLLVTSVLVWPEPAQPLALRLNFSNQALSQKGMLSCPSWLKEG